jgi:hypothetical protein
MMMNRRFFSVRFHPFIIAAFSAALFLPIIGRGFMQDDFDHLYSVAHYSLLSGLTHIQGGAFYAPVAWLSYRIEWDLWGYDPFPFAVTNLILHLANIVAVYYLANGLWQSSIAARWAAIGYSLLYPANVSAVMFSGTRAHLLATLFYLLSMLTASWFVKTDSRKLLAAALTVAFAALAIFSKESGVMAPIAIALVLYHQKRGERWRPREIRAILGLFAAIFAVLCAYFILRSFSGAIPIRFSCTGYGYCLDLAQFLKHIYRYTWRTFGLLTVVGLAIAASRYLLGYRPRLNSLNKHDLILSSVLFAVTVAPILLVNYSTGIYTYLPGISAALLLGATARSLHESALKRPSLLAPAAFVPVILIVAGYSISMAKDSYEWMTMEKTNMLVLNQIIEQHPSVKPSTTFILRYAQDDNNNKFPHGLNYGFPYALRFLYSDPTLNGMIIRYDEPCQECNNPSAIQLAYTIGSNGSPQVDRIITRSEQAP